MKTGTSTRGNWLTSSLGRSKANNWNGDGEVKNPAVTATTRSASPKRFHAVTRSAFLCGARAIGTIAAILFGLRSALRNAGWTTYERTVTIRAAAITIIGWLST